jgi:hypothetical protein
VLLIAAALPADELASLCRMALDHGLDVLAEVHNETELAAAVRWTLTGPGRSWPPCPAVLCGWRRAGSELTRTWKSWLPPEPMRSWSVNGSWRSRPRRKRFVSSCEGPGWALTENHRTVTGPAVAAVGEEWSHGRD